ncbi:DUF421 domain-containing protein [Negadavirga shengliensis]|uniref:DUF421 domain-containing protein n=1 Tax=Negadavirga shengliensis TaxID=1389218 RepID=A0ABV9T354_9BACT
MKKEEIDITDIERILLGEAPAEFLIETLLRTLIIFLVLLVFLRLIGKRMGGMLTFTELAVMLTLGAVLAVPMQTPDRGLLQGIIILSGILFFHRGLNLYEFKKPKLEFWTQGKATILVKDGIIQNKNLRSARISKHQLYSALRNKNILNLGKVKRVYLESYGLFSIYEFEKKRAGLSILPSSDADLIDSKNKEEVEYIACLNCGYSEKPAQPNPVCKICNNQQWKKATF